MLGLPTLLASSCAFLAYQPQLQLAVPLLVGVTAVMVAILSAVLYLGERDRPCWSPAFILAIALLLRLMFLFSPAQLSDDIYRYLWDGANLLRGVNPYASAPAAMVPPPALREIHAQVNHPQYATIYPPTAQLLFAAGAAAGGVVGMKAVLVLADLVLCALLMVLLRRVALPAWLAILYAWNPLPVIEIAGSGHVDGAGLALLAGSLCLALSGHKSGRPSFYSGALFGAAGMVKLYPLALFPALFLLIPPGRRLHFCTGFVGSLLVLALPFLPHLANMLETLEAYARHWEFAGFAFTALRTVTGSGTVARLILCGAFLSSVLAVTFRLAATVGRAEAVSRGTRALSACYALAFAFLLCTPTLQPWYALFLVVFLPFAPGPAGLVLGWVVFLTYRVQIPYFILGQWQESAQVTAAVFLAPVTAWGVYRLVRAKVGTANEGSAPL